jgi:hypothetical protein
MLWHKLIGGLSVGPPEITYTSGLTSNADTSAGATYTYGNVTIGEPAPDRLVVAVWSGTGGTVGQRVVNSCTIAESSATIHVNSSQTSRSGVCIASRLVTSGTTATFTCTWNDSMLNSRLDVYTITGLSSYTPRDVQSNELSTAGTVNSITLDTGVGGVILAAGRTGSAVTTHTWNSPFVRDSFTLVETRYTSTASCIASGSTQTAQLTVNASDDFNICAASWI